MGGEIAVESRPGQGIQLDERYRPFANQLSLLARNYQPQAVLRLVEEYRQGSLASHAGR